MLNNSNKASLNLSMENPSHHISIVIRIGKEKISAPPKARASPMKNDWAAILSGDIDWLR
jgi:hypothetical protein